MQKSIRVFTSHDSANEDPFAVTIEQVSEYLQSYEVANKSRDIQIIPQVTEIVYAGTIGTRYTITVVVTWEA